MLKAEFYAMLFELRYIIQDKDDYRNNFCGAFVEALTFLNFRSQSHSI